MNVRSFASGFACASLMTLVAIYGRPRVASSLDAPQALSVEREPLAVHGEPAFALSAPAWFQTSAVREENLAPSSAAVPVSFCAQYVRNGRALRYSKLGVDLTPEECTFRIGGLGEDTSITGLGGYDDD